MWTCPKCHERVDPSFDVCWNCGTSVVGDEDPDFVRADESGPIDDPRGFLRLDVGTPKDELDELPPPPLELVPCFQASSLIEAQFVANELNAAGIPATVENTFGDGTGGLFPQPILYGAQVVVRAEDLPRARAWVDPFEANLKARHAPEGDFRLRD